MTGDAPLLSTPPADPGTRGPAGAAVVSAPVEWVLRAAARTLAWVWWWVVPVRRAVALDNLARSGVAPGRRAAGALARDSVYHLVWNFLELPLLMLGGRRAVRSRIEVRGLEPLLAALAEGRGALAVTAHLGSWEALAVVARALDVPLTLVVRPPRGWVSRWAIGLTRRAAGAELLAAGGVLAGARRAMARARLLGMVGDQRPPPRQALAGQMLGVDADLPTAPALIAVRLALPVFVVLVRRRADGRHEVTVQGPWAPRPSGTRDDPVEALARRMHAAIETGIRASPEQWLWLHDRWRRTGCAASAPVPTPGGP